VTPPAGKRSSTTSSPAAKRAPFELLAFTAAPVAGALVVVELEGRFAAAQGSRFARQPVLVVEAGDDRPRLELAPVRATLAGGRWRSAYAIPAETFPGARFALGLRGTLLELPAPDEPDDADRLTALAREANSLRRALEAAEAEVAATSADLGAAVSAARDEALAKSTDRITALEAELAEAREEAEQRAQAEQERARLAEEGAEQLAAARAADAEARVRAAEERARVAEAGADERARVAEEAALAAGSGIEVLRAELAEERERSRLAIAELEAARRRADALRNAAAAEAAARASLAEDDATQPLAAGAIGFDEDDDATRPLVIDFDDEDDATRPLDIAVANDDDATRPLDIAAGAGASAAPAQPVTLSSRRGRTVRPQTSPATAHAAAPRGPGPWIAVGALALFAFALLGLLVGFLP
jgi:hypothetical protein